MKQDLRIKKTYLALTTTFLKLLQQKRFEDITVNELCEAAMVRRATFYKHFADKTEFFTFLVKEVQRDFLEKNATATVTSKQFYQNIITSMFDFIDENELLVSSVMKSSMLPLLLDVISEQTSNDVLQQIKKDQIDGHKLKAPEAVLAQLFTGALMNITKWWIVQKKKIPKAQIIDQTCELLLQNF
ncbi:MAG: TetR/AcrR family transcriptional regulator [Erysipelotrichaceae bacterium]